jgi:hypothetical protein
MEAGSYNTKFIWVKRTGTKPETFENTNYGKELWGSLRHMGSNELMAQGSKYSKADSVIYLHNSPTIKTVDRLIEKETGVVWLVDGVIDERHNARVKILAHTYGV